MLKNFYYTISWCVKQDQLTPKRISYVWRKVIVRLATSVWSYMCRESHRTVSCDNGYQTAVAKSIRLDVPPHVTHLPKDVAKSGSCENTTRELSFTTGANRFGSETWLGINVLMSRDICLGGCVELLCMGYGDHVPSASRRLSTEAVLDFYQESSSMEVGLCIAEITILSWLMST